MCGVSNSPAPHEPALDHILRKESTAVLYCEGSEVCWQRHVIYVVHPSRNRGCPGPLGNVSNAASCITAATHPRPWTRADQKYGRVIERSRRFL